MLRRIIIDNFKSIRHADISFGNINILIGENGAGKSNMISFIELAKTSVSTNDLHQYVLAHMGMSRLLYGGLKDGGLKETKQFSGTLIFNNPVNDLESTDYAYSFTIGSAVDSTTPVLLELAQYTGTASHSEYPDKGRKNLIADTIGNNRAQNLNVDTNKPNIVAESECQTYYGQPPIDSIKIYHFCDTGNYSKIKSKVNINDNISLKKDGSNLAAILYLISQTSPQSFRMIEEMMKRIAPYFKCFELKPDRLNPDLITIEWREKDSSVYHDSTSFSDGTIRFLALCTLLLQQNPPATIIIDEPELGLHPSAISIISALIKRASHKSQIIIATQSADLISEFTLNDIIVVDRTEGQSLFRKLKEEDFQQWIEDYSIGEIWKKNIIGGRP